MILDSTLTHPRGDQTALALHAFNASQADRRARYLAALALVREIDDALERSVFHYRRRDGGLMTTLDEVVRAVIDKTLDIETEASDG